MTIEMSHSKATEEVIKIPAIGLELGVRVDPSTTGGAFCFIDTVNAPGFGPPRHRHKETEVFRVMEGRYLFEVDGARFYADEGDVVTVPGGAAHAFVNVTDRPARQYILIAPGLDARAFFLGLADVMRDGRPDTAALNVFAKTWDVEFLGPPLTVPTE
ncbi:cupin domain-containing protein [Rhizobium sp. AN80A]|uniref:cupin domain-containing protein n=1 Tax=Rhizobium sp. AN80A TaxID=3040673 RepID=UPI0024B3AD85|nr:cupin domain-containing protein [Rhizobium sp. AN80A]